jgi:hypothetical protein
MPPRKTLKASAGAAPASGRASGQRLLAISSADSAPACPQSSPPRRCPLLMGPLRSPTSDRKAAAPPAHLAQFGTWPDCPTRSLVLNVAPSSLAALARSPSLLAFAASSLPFAVSSAAPAPRDSRPAHGSSSRQSSARAPASMPVTWKPHSLRRLPRTAADRPAWPGTPCSAICPPSGSAAIVPWPPAESSPLPGDAPPRSCPGRS